MSIGDEGFYYYELSVVVTAHTRGPEGQVEPPRKWHANLKEEQGEEMIAYLVKNYNFETV